MSCKEVTYYQAVCDVCGTVHDGEFSAWADPSDASTQASYDGWIEVEVPLAADATEYDSIRTTTGEKWRSILICGKHGSDGIEWCEACEEDLNEDGWRISEDGKHIIQVCESGHENNVPLGGEGQ
ncbi:hypothetical protein [Galactobacter valiniphilus]|uniref:hypothetical protein n=1 Tax=Galactobacter valiniphilus TaxID=2676122 RepID=UPI00373542CF